MSTIQRTRDAGTRNAALLLQRLGTELRDARLSAGLSQERVAAAAGMSQSAVSRVELAQATGVTILDLARHCSALGLRLTLKTFPAGVPVRDAAQLSLIDRLRPQLHPIWRQSTEMLVGAPGDLRAWDLFLRGTGTIGLDAETRLHDLQALQRRCEAKARDSGVDRIVLLVADTHHNRRVLREHREALRSTFPLDTRAVMATLRVGALPAASGIVLL